MNKKAKIIMIGNQKGGIGKTTTTLELGAMLSEKKKKVLLIDTDGQCNLSLYCNIKKNDFITNGPYDFSVRGLLLAAQSSDGISDDFLDKCIRNTDEGFDLIISSQKLVNAQKEFGEPDDIYLLGDVMDKLKDRYDYILIDTAPARGPVMYMSYLTADYNIILSEADDGSIQGIEQVAADILSLKKRRISTPKPLGILLVRDKMTNEQTNSIQKMYNAGSPIDAIPFDITIPESIIVTEAHNNRCSISRYLKETDKKTKKKGLAVMDAYEQLLKEILNKIKICESED